MTAIVPLAARHCHSLARLHLAHLSTEFKGEPGRRLLQAYYRAVAEGRGACGYVAEEDGRVMGYVCGVWDRSALRAVLLRQHRPELLAWGAAQVIIQPRLITSLTGRLRQPAHELELAEPGYELRPIVVAPAARGNGLAAELVRVLLADAARRGFQRMHLVTEVDNMAANALYRKMGFQPVGTLSRTGISYTRYEFSIL